MSVHTKAGARALILARNPDLEQSRLRFEILNVVSEPSGGASVTLRWWDGTVTELYLTAAECGGIPSDPQER